MDDGFISLHAGHLTVRRFAPDDVDALVAYRNDPSVAQHGDWPLPYTRDQAASFIEALQGSHPGEHGSWFQFAIERNGELSGDIGLFVDDSGTVGSLGISLRRSDHNQGFGTEAAGAIIDYAFRVLRLERFEVSVESRNAPSQALARKLGFAPIGERPYDNETGAGTEYIYELTKAQHRWNRRYAAEDIPNEPSDWLVASADLLPRQGRALDVAAGAGRNAVWLARRGLDVVAVDVSPVAIDATRRRADSTGVGVTTLRLDLERSELPQGSWNVILCLHYLQRDLMPKLSAALAPGGLLVVSLATVRNLERHDRPPLPFLVEEGEVPTFVAGLERVRYEEGWTESGRHEARLVALQPR